MKTMDSGTTGPFLLTEQPVEIVITNELKNINY